MGRTKSLEAVVIEDFLAANNGNPCRYSRFLSSIEYQNHIARGGKSVGQAFYNAVKSRYNRNNVVAASASATSSFQGGMGVPSSTSPTNSNVNNAATVLSSVSSMSFDVSEHEYSDEIKDMIPEPDNHFVFTDANKDIVDLVQQHSKVGNVNIRLVGPAGCGKTSFAINYAAKRKAPALVMDCANVREPRDWFGYRTFDPATKDIVWHESLFVKMVETPGSVIVLDELNRVSPMVTNTLIPLLDHRRLTYLEEAGRSIRIAEGVTFWAAINEGNQFTGTVAMDSAMRNRFSYVVECNFLDPKTECSVLRNKTGLDTDSCRKLVEVANQVRTKAMMDDVDSFSEPISTRMLESAALAMSMGGPKTLAYTLLNHYSGAGGASSERESLRKLLVGKFGSI